MDFESGGYIQIEIPPYEYDFKDFEGYRRSFSSRLGTGSRSGISKPSTRRLQLELIQWLIIRQREIL